jgi:hypothetical protein
MLACERPAGGPEIFQVGETFDQLLLLREPVEGMPPR